MTRPELRWGAATDAGLVREANEDAYLVVSPLFVVADGMGGHQAGEVASALAIEVMRSRLAETAITYDAMVDAVVEANRAIYATAAGNAAQLGMGTTLTALALATGDQRDLHDPSSAADDRSADNAGDDAGDDTDEHPRPADADDDPADDPDQRTVHGDHSDPHPDADTRAGTDPDPDTDPDTGPDTGTADAAYLVLVNVGDSRTYRLRNGDLQRATLDHSYVQELINAGHLTDDEARLHPRRNIVTRALGIEADVIVDAWALPVVRGDRFVLCSDGLVDEVVDADIRDIVNTHTDPQDAAERLVAAAIANGGRDNITVVVVDVLDPSPLSPSPSPASPATSSTSPTSATSPVATSPATTTPADEHPGDAGAATHTEPDDPNTAAATEPNVPTASVEPAPLEDDTGPIPAVVPPPAERVDHSTTPVIRPPATTPRPRGPIIAAVIGIALLIVIGVVVLLAITGDDDTGAAPQSPAATATTAAPNTASDTADPADATDIDTASASHTDDGGGMG